MPTELIEKNSPTVYRSDYQPYPFTLDAVALNFELDENRTAVTSTLRFTAKDKAPADLVLNAEDISLDALYLNGQALGAEAYELNQDQLVIAQLSGSFELRVCTTLDPAANSLFMGLYKSGSGFFTQCEAEGFRRITYFPDRPDVMSIYTVTLAADKKKYPYLLSNGNLLSSTDLPDGRHQAVWHDPFHKPSYLFALVAGDFDVREKLSKPIMAATCCCRYTATREAGTKPNGHWLRWSALWSGTKSASAWNWIWIAS
ncbi:aminopeptidase N [Advenella kashmirensis WT001]|uniref:Aminopeptidase N n=1 Tax=Advenella kashmirensis (strain DSM 17095 / LMG 22695 / WT001) TaxID=1036672 RepID=I3UBE4_ADVKW|nr:aminopeptidase N [Advenella kashmirensis WT001]